MSGYNVGDLVAEFLSAAGVRTTFGIVSVHNIPMLDAIARRNAIRFVMARGELGGAHMADGYARASGGLGVLISSTGPGAANAVGGLAEARIAGSPVLHVTGTTITRFADREMGTVHDVPDQSGMLRSVSKSAYRIRSPQQALGVLTRAAIDALTPPTGPVSVEVPIDIQRTAIDRPALLDFLHAPAPAPLAPDAAVMEELAARVMRARRPMLWLGAGARHAGGQAAALLDLGFGMVTSLAGRGVVTEDHPVNLGGFNGNGIPLVQAFYEGCDLMLVAGSRLRGHETGDFSVKLPANLIQVDADPLANGRTYPNAFFVQGDAAAVLGDLGTRLQGRWRADAAFPGEVAALKERVRAAYPGTLGPYADFAAQLRAVMPRDALWVRDITLSNSTWGHRLFPVHAPRDNIYPVGAGIGQGLQLGIGAALASDGRKTVVLTGDGGFFLNMTELWTAVQERLDMVTIVMNDAGYGVIRHIQDSLYGGRRSFHDLLTPDLGQLAACAGVPFFKVARAEDFGAEVARAIAINGPTLVEVDMRAIGEFPPYPPYDKKL